MGVLEATPASQNIMLVGRHGIGKSQILTQYFEGKGMKVQSLFLGQMSDPGDLIGLPKMNPETGRTEFSMPYWFPTDGKPIVLFLDELNRARPEVLQSVMDLALNRKLSGRALPEGSRIISAVNDGEAYQLTDLDPALVSRFNIYEFSPTVEEWLLWAEQSKIDKRVVAFIAQHHDCLDVFDAKISDSCLEKTPDRRAWHKVSDAIQGVKEFDNMARSLVAGIIGLATTQKFFAFLRLDKKVDGYKLLTDFDKCASLLEKYSLADFALLDESIFRTLETHDFTKDKVAKVTANLLKYVETCLRPRKELMAHFVSCYKNNLYTKARTFILLNAKSLSMEIKDYIMNM